MSRLAPLDKALVLILVPLWVVCFSLGVRTQLRGGAVAMVGLSVEDADSYPALTGVYGRNIHPSDPLVQAGLRAGDRLVQMGNADLRGVGTLGFIGRTLDESGREALSVPLVFERDDERRETSLALVPVSIFGPPLTGSFALAVSALFLLLRARPTPTVRAWFYCGMSAAFCTCLFPGSGLQFYFSWGVTAAALSVFFASSFNFLFRFPDDRAPESPWHRIWPWFFSVPHGLFFLLSFSNQMGLGQMGFTATVVLGFLASLVVATRKYQRADLVGRRQMKWVLLGFYCVALALAVSIAASVLDPRLGWLWFASYWAVPLVPLALVISVVRFNLFDIDRLLSATASYNILLVLLGAAALVVVPRLSEAASGLVGIDPGTGQVALSLLL
ncbi:MAG: PDZ domain-containing protein, partial [Gemmatimonadota bacterium]|nr:PDZ domain-containing protein [Gemmatimonadota bacterium]